MVPVAYLVYDCYIGHLLTSNYLVTSIAVSKSRRSSDIPCRNVAGSAGGSCSPQVL